MNYSDHGSGSIDEARRDPTLIMGSGSSSADATGKPTGTCVGGEQVTPDSCAGFRDRERSRMRLCCSPLGMVALSRVGELSYSHRVRHLIKIIRAAKAAIATPTVTPTTTPVESDEDPGRGAGELEGDGAYPGHCIGMRGQCTCSWVPSQVLVLYIKRTCSWVQA